MASVSAGQESRFLALTDREEFREYWAKLVRMRGGSLQACKSLAEACRGTKGETIALLIVDSAYCPLSDILHDPALSTLRRETHILLAAAPYSVDEELAALAAGISGCCAGNLGAEELGTVIDVVLKGGIWVSRSALPLLLSRLQGAVKTEQRAAPSGSSDAVRFASAWATLTKREREIAVQVAAGDSNKVIASAFEISGATIKAHLTSIYQKLGVSSRLQLALLVSGASGQGLALAATNVSGAVAASAGALVS